jgi:hypothetical protein
MTLCWAKNPVKNAKSHRMAEAGEPGTKRAKFGLGKSLKNWALLIGPWGLEVGKREENVPESDSCPHARVMSVTSMESVTTALGKVKREK